MKLHCAIIFLGFFAAFACQARANDDGVSKTVETRREYTQEEDCSRFGGMCVESSGCPAEKLSEKGTCPKQANDGAVCCHSLSMQETICEKLGGLCRQNCPEPLVIGRADDCENGLKCCPLL